jgi:SAM-dependent methyltransferase
MRHGYSRLKQLLNTLSKRHRRHLLNYIQETTCHRPLQAGQQRRIKWRIIALYRQLAPADRTRVLDFAQYLHWCMSTRVSTHQHRSESSVSGWQPTPRRIVVEALRLAGAGPEDTIYDLGCGDGRVLAVAARRFSARCIGFEIDRTYIRKTRKRIARAGMSELACVRRQSMFAIPDLYKATLVYLYLPQKAVTRVVPVLARWCREGTRVVTVGTWNYHWNPARQICIHGQTRDWWVGVWST